MPFIKFTTLAAMADNWTGDTFFAVCPLAVVKGDPQNMLTITAGA